MRSDGIVSRFHIALASGVVDGLRPALAVQRLREVEPALAAYVDAEQRELVRMLEDAQVPGDLLTALARRQLTALLRTVDAVRHAHYELWEETEVGRRLSASDPALADLDVLADYKDRWRRERARQA